VAFRKRWCAAPARQSPADRAGAQLRSAGVSMAPGSSKRCIRRVGGCDACQERTWAAPKHGRRDGLVAIIGDLTARHVPGALTLQERVMQLR